MIKIHKNKPADFTIQANIAGCYIEIDKKILLLQTNLSKKEAHKWGVPAGKIDVHETPVQGALRELFEETGIFVDRQEAVVPVGPLYISKPEFSYVYHMFKIMLNEKPSIKLSLEHQNYIWAARKEVKDMNLMEGAYEALLHYYKQTIQ